MGESDISGVPRIQDVRRPAIGSRITKRIKIQLKASAVPPNLSGDLEAKSESQKIEIQSLQRYLTSTQGPLCSWDEVNLHSIQGVHVDDSVGTSTSSASRITEPAITHLPQDGGDPELFQLRALNSEGSTNFGCTSEYVTSEHFESSNGCTQVFYSDDFFIESTNSTVTVPDFGQPNREKPSQLSWQMASTNRT